MATDNPFADFDHHKSPGVDNGKPLLTVFAILACLVLFFCGGMGTLLFYVYRQSNPAPFIELPQRTDDFRKSLDEFNEGLAKLKASADSSAPPQPDAAAEEIELFVRSSLESLEFGDPIPFNNAMFAEAVNKSRIMQGRMTAFQRVQLVGWLNESPPYPWTGGDCKVVQIRHVQENLATVDFLLYVGDSESETFRWNLVKETDGWELYDWRAFDFGQTMSDEYAGYVSNPTVVAEGYDVVADLISQADEAYGDDDLEAAKGFLEQAEATQTLPSDRPGARVRIAYAWSRLDDVDQALRLLKLVDDPDSLLSAWSLEAYCYREKGDTGSAMRAIDSLAALSPDHPNVHLARSEIWANRGDEDKSAQAATEALAIVPEDATTWRLTLARSSPEVTKKMLPQWIPLMISGNQGDIWLMLIAEVKSANAWSTLIPLLESNRRTPGGIELLARGYQAANTSKSDEAAQLFLQAERECEFEMVAQHARTKRLNVRLEQEQYDELLSDDPNISTTLEALTKAAYDYELVCDEVRLLAALESKSFDTPWASCLQGSLNATLYRYDQALNHFVKLDDWLEQRLLKEDVAKGDPHQDAWIAEAVRRDYVFTLLALQRPMDVVTRWPGSSEPLFAVGDYLVGNNDRALSLAFLRDTEQDGVEQNWKLITQQRRLRAAQAIADGDFLQANQHHIAAFRTMRQASDVDPSLYSDLITEHVRLMLLKSSEFVTPEYDEQEHIDEFAFSVAYFAHELRDRAAFEKSRAMLKRDPANRPFLFAKELELLQAVGKTEAATKLCEDFLPTPPSKVEDHPRNLIADHFLRVGRFDEALNLLMQSEETESAVPHAATVALAKGDGSSVLKLLEGVDRDVVSPWLYANDRWLRIHATKPWIAILYERYPRRIDASFPSESGELLFPADTRISQTELELALEGSLGGRFEVAEVRNAEPSSNSWKCSSLDGKDQLVITVSSVKLQPSLVRADLRQHLEKPVLRVSMEWLGAAARSREHLLKLAAQLAERGALAFCLHAFADDHVIWSGPQLKQKLQWDSRIPSSEDATTGYFVNATNSDVDRKSSEEWRKLLDEAGGRLPVTLTMSTRNCSERLRGEIRDVDPETWRFTVRLLESSQLDPLVVAGREYYCYSYMLLSPNVEDNR